MEVLKILVLVMVSSPCSTGTVLPCDEKEYAELGERFSIDCHLSDIGNVFWYSEKTAFDIPIVKLENGRKTISDGGRSRYDISETGALIINEVTKNDFDQYKMLHVLIGRPIEEAIVTLQQAIAPKRSCPQIGECFDCRKCVIKNTDTITCSVSGSRPLVNFTFDAINMTHVTNTTTKIQYDNSSDTWTTSSTINIHSRSCNMSLKLGCKVEGNNRFELSDSYANVQFATNIPPVATCPADVNVVSAQGNIGSVANFNNAVCSDSEDPAGSIIASCDPQPGSFFQGLGITAVTCACTDSAGESNSCVFNVNVMPFVLGSPSELNLPIIIVPIILLSVLCLVILAICLSCRRKRTRAKQQNIQLQPLPKPSVSEIQTDDDYETADVGNETVNYNGDSVVCHRSGVVLSNRLQSSGRIIRWIASLRNTGRKSFVASTLSENSSRNDKREYRVFAEHLRNMPRHKNVVDTIGCDTNEVPYYIYTEYVTNGRLKDYLEGISEANSTYSTSIYTEGEGSKSLDSQNKQLATFALHVLEALIFLESVDCDHPGLSAGKVLLDANNNCKLYDFNLCSTTHKIISQLQFEGSSRLKWYAPETIFNREYAETSDVWSYALFLWEVFSLGQNPFENLDAEGIKSAIHVQPVLPQTKCCPNMIYSLIKNCLQIDPERRMKFPHLRNSLQQFIGGSTQVASKEYR